MMLAYFVTLGVVIFAFIVYLNYLGDKQRFLREQLQFERSKLLVLEDIRNLLEDNQGAVQPLLVSPQMKSVVKDVLRNYKPERR